MLQREAAYHLAHAIVHSDAWVQSERDPHDVRLQQEEDELFKSYMALRQAVS